MIGCNDLRFCSCASRKFSSSSLRGLWMSFFKESPDSLSIVLCTRAEQHRSVQKPPSALQGWDSLKRRGSLVPQAGMLSRTSSCPCLSSRECPQVCKRVQSASVQLAKTNSRTAEPVENTNQIFQNSAFKSKWCAAAVTGHRSLHDWLGSVQSSDGAEP